MKKKHQPHEQFDNGNNANSFFFSLIFIVVDKSEVTSSKNTFFLSIFFEFLFHGHRLLDWL